jgi:hypothetical protein
MVRNEQQLRRWKYALGFLFLGIAIVHFILSIASEMPSLLTPQYQFDAYIVPIIFQLFPILGFVMVGLAVLKVRDVPTMRFLVIATAIALVVGSVIGISIQILSMGPNEAGLAVGLYALYPLPLFLLMLFANPIPIALGSLLILFTPHIIAIILFSGYAYWIATNGQSVREAVRCSLYLAMAIVLFALLAGVICKTIVLPANFFSIQSAYIDWSMLFGVPIFQLLLYALVFGVIGAWLHRFGRVARA